MIYTALYLVVSVIAVFGGGIWFAISTLDWSEDNAR